MNSRIDRDFREAFARLPRRVQDQARRAFRRWLEDPFHPGLHFKSIHPTLPVYSVRIGLHYRAVGVRDGDTVSWFWIGSHADYDRLISSL